MILLVCGILWMNPVTHVVRRACLPIEYTRHGRMSDVA